MTDVWPFSQIRRPDYAHQDSGDHNPGSDARGARELRIRKQNMHCALLSFLHTLPFPTQENRRPCELSKTLVGVGFEPTRRSSPVELKSTALTTRPTYRHDF